MTIHVVQPGETLDAIAAQYGVSPSLTQQLNALPNPDNLVPGQTVVILTPAETYTVQPGDSLLSVAQTFGVSVDQLWRNNPFLGGLSTLTPGQTLVIAFDDVPQGTLSVIGYAYPFIDRAVLRQTLPYLTYLTVFTYGFEPDGTLVTIDDDEVVALAREYNVAPLMLISTLTPGGTFSNELASAVLNNPVAQEALINNILDVLRAKQYAGLDVDFEYILPADRAAFADFVQTLSDRLNAEGFVVFIALAPKTSDDQPGLLYEAHDYGALGAAANYALLMTYEWGYTYGPPMAVAPFDKVTEVLDYALTRIPAEKLLLGIPNYGYDWTLPFVRGESQARALSNVAAVEQAAQVGAAIQFDPVAQAPFYTYTDPQGREHIVWFEDARSIRAKLELAGGNDLNGVGYWNVMRYFPQNWLVLNALFTLRQVL